MIPYLDLKPMHEPILSDIKKVIDDVLQKSHYIMGEHCAQFDLDYARYCDVKHSMGVSNGLDGLKMALRAVGVGPGDEVVVPANSFIATALAVSDLNAKVIFCDVDPETHNMSVRTLEPRLTKKTKAVIPVHLYGLVSDIEDLVSFCKSKNIFLIEDAAQAHGATFNGKMAGGFGDVASFSFYPGKNLGALGDGGAVTTNDDGIAQQVKLLRNYGSVEKYQHLIQGANCRLDEIQAAILSVKLKRLGEWNRERRALAKKYLQKLKQDHFTLPVVPNGADPVWHIFSVQVRGDRDALKNKLADKGLQCSIHYPLPIHKQPAYKAYANESYPVSEKQAMHCLSLPLWPGIDSDRVIEIINSI